MPRMTIDQFRARLANDADAGPLARLYQALSRRAEVARAGALRLDWSPWPPAAQM